MDFPKRLAQFREQKRFTQNALADKAGISVTQLRRYEGGTSQPTLDVIRALAVRLAVTSDALIFGKDTRGPDDEMRFLFEAVNGFQPEEKKVAKVVLESLILKHEAKRWTGAA